MTTVNTEQRTYRRNFILIALNGIISSGAYALFDPVMVLTAFIVKTNGSEILVGLAGTLPPLAVSWPQIFVANLIQSKPRKLYVYRWAVVGRILTYVALAILMWHYRGGLPPWFSYAFLGIIFVHWSITGIAQVPVMDTIGKAVRPEDRPVVFAWRNSGGMGLTLLSGLVVAWALSDQSGLTFPNDYLLLLIMMTIGISVGLACFALVNEPVEEGAVSPRLPWREYFRNGPELLRNDANYRWLLIGFFAFAVSLSTMPFLVPFLIRRVGMGAEVAGPLMILSALGSMGLTAYFGWLGRKRGNKQAVLVSTWLGIFVPGLSLAAALLDGGSVLGVDIRFILVGIAVVLARLSTSGMNMGKTNFLLDIAPPAQRATYIAFWTVFVTVTALIPLGVGALIESFGYEAVFAIASLFGFIALLSFRNLVDPREKEQQEFRGGSRISVDSEVTVVEERE